MNTESALTSILEKRFSARGFESRSLAKGKLDTMLARIVLPAVGRPPRLPMAGGIYSSRFAISVSRVDGVDSGTYLVTSEAALQPVNGSEDSAKEACFYTDCGQAAAVLFHWFDPASLLPKYGHKAFALANQNSGVVALHAYLVCAELGILCCYTPFVTQVDWLTDSTIFSNELSGVSACVIGE